ncbi:hypothetical protein SAMN05660297_02683 [Natronincola peptidivorans]|uniref:Flavoprotein n=1 Tax=Natronincola peptidivorans TaxID=426128 RepID=A0A1I0F5W7_9FIRM|nr:hypothetical protein [Natronincola peptidivorans]SET52822.1 hypothetical protein SAMN05660297_02683 [Natronincola peptidivorans]
MNRYNQTKKIMEHLILKNNNSFSKEKKEHLMIVFTGTVTDQEKYLKQLEGLKNQGYSFDFTISSNGEKLLNIDELCKLLQPRKVYRESSSSIEVNSMEGIEGILVPLATQNTAIKLSLGIQDQLIPKLLWEALWMGKPIWMNYKSLSEYKGTTTSNPYIQEKIKLVLLELEKMGVKSLECFDDIRKSPLDNFDVKNEKASTGHRVITERDVLAFDSSNLNMMVPSDAIITPLAKDTAKARGIKIIKG